MTIDAIQIPPALLIIMGGLAGSIITLIIGKAIDFFHEKKKQVYTLQKEYFKNKLKAAEEIYATAQHATYLLESLSKFIKEIPDAVSRGDQQKCLTSFNELSSRMQQFMEAVQSYSHLSWRCALYFDTNTSLYEDHPAVKEMIEKIPRNMANIHNLASQSVDDDSAFKLRQDEAIRLLNEISEAIDELSKIIENAAKEIRKEVRKYDT